MLDLDTKDILRKAREHVDLRLGGMERIGASAEAKSETRHLLERIDAALNPSAVTRTCEKCGAEHEEWGSRIMRGTFDPREWARDLKCDIAAYQEADAALRKDVDENEGDDPMSDEYKVLYTRRTFAASNVTMHLNHDVLIAIADIVSAKSD